MREMEAERGRESEWQIKYEACKAKCARLRNKWAEECGKTSELREELARKVEEAEGGDEEETQLREKVMGLEKLLAEKRDVLVGMERDTMQMRERMVEEQQRGVALVETVRRLKKELERRDDVIEVIYYIISLSLPLFSLFRIFLFSSLLLLTLLLIQL